MVQIRARNRNLSQSRNRNRNRNRNLSKVGTGTVIYQNLKPPGAVKKQLRFRNTVGNQCGSVTLAVYSVVCDDPMLCSGGSRRPGISQTWFRPGSSTSRYVADVAQEENPLNRFCGVCTSLVNHGCCLGESTSVNVLLYSAFFSRF